uniref:Omega-hydroxypalmitate O-feruloyl transferase n=1 Tax=Ananas comosus var. bracteatus TaxID=296719 RepID=A0A6V7QIA6_ANACO|nr:unnamed protein product [Ananas comosus var. bracteatus]
MTKSIEIPDIFYPKEPILVCPSSPTPNHTLQLSNLDDQKFLRFSIKYLYLFRKALLGEALRASLAKVLVDYYPFAGRCNGEGAVFAEGFVDLTAGEFLEGSGKPNRSWRKLLHRVEAQSFVGIPPLVIQVTHLRCGGMILCTAISHCLCDGIGSAQFLHAWAHITAKPNFALPIAPFHDRHMLKPEFPTNHLLSPRIQSPSL